MTTYAITRHQGAAEWIKVRVGDCTIITHVGDAELAAIKPGDRVIGILPLNLAASICAAGARVESIDLPALRPDQRGKELSLSEMDAAGAALTEYRVERIEHRPARRAVFRENGFFILSEAGKAAYIAAGGTPPAQDDSWGWDRIPRHDPALVAAVEAIGNAACLSEWSRLKIIDIPAGQRYCIHADHSHDGTMIDTLKLESDMDWS